MENFVRPHDSLSDTFKEITVKTTVFRTVKVFQCARSDSGLLVFDCIRSGCNESFVRLDGFIHLFVGWTLVSKRFRFEKSAGDRIDIVYVLSGRVKRKFDVIDDLFQEIARAF
ncbi:hypothetical protein DF133_13170 [Burkholderia cenocepacia]|nr:hypothetical protein DF133_13170 [Burkholderia cenocepacia]